jgi:glycosyltransferase involved in cell wall biosynthesis
LIESVLGQQHQGFEWVLLDNGSSHPKTLELIESLKQYSFVTVLRFERNVGIIRGMHAVLQQARNRYVAPLDSDDLLVPNCVGLVTSFLSRAGYPTLAYTDEDRVKGEAHLEPFCKPDWDPVLFFHSCYIAHLCVIDRQAAIALGAYTDPSTNGCHDWDTFTRFYLAGYKPIHIPHIVYSWRIHSLSSASNMGAKDYIGLSHRRVLGRLISTQAAPDEYRLISSPLFQDGVNWRFIKTRSTLQFTTIKLDTAGPVHWSQLATAAAAAVEERRLVHLLDPAVTIDGPDWQNEAETLLSLFKDTAVIGGFLHYGGRLFAADSYFAFADGVRSPNFGRLIADAGYFGQAWKPHSCDMVPTQHCIVRPEILLKTCKLLMGTCATLAGLGLWLGRVATRHNARVVFSPMVRAKLTAPAIKGPSLPECNAHIAIERIKPVGRGWPRELGRTPTTAFQHINAVTRQNEERLFGRIGSFNRIDPAACSLVMRFVEEVDC